MVVVRPVLVPRAREAVVDVVVVGEEGAAGVVDVGVDVVGEDEDVKRCLEEELSFSREAIHPRPPPTRNR